MPEVRIPATAPELERLREEIRRHDHLYYVEARPVLTDREYDALMAALAAAEAAHPEWVTPDSPSQRVGGAPAPGFAAAPHSAPMLSLGNTYTLEELREFDARVRKGLGVERVGYVVELKIDGVAIALRYRDGRLALGLTRGDGRVGRRRHAEPAHDPRAAAGCAGRTAGAGRRASSRCAARSTCCAPTSRALNRGARRARRAEPFMNPRNLPPARSRRSTRARWRGGRCGSPSTRWSRGHAMACARRRRRWR